MGISLVEGGKIWLSEGKLMYFLLPELLHSNENLARCYPLEIEVALEWGRLSWVDKENITPLCVLSWKENPPFLLTSYWGSSSTGMRLKVFLVGIWFIDHWSGKQTRLTNMCISCIRIPDPKSSKYGFIFFHSFNIYPQISLFSN